MAAQPIRVEIIGADLEQRWANASHVPALTVDRDFDPVAVGTQTESSARVPTEQFGGPHAVNDTQSLAEHPDVAIVGESAKVPCHRKLVQFAFDTGKMISCVWPRAHAVDRMCYWRWEIGALLVNSNNRPTTMVGLQLFGATEGDATHWPEAVTPEYACAPEMPTGRSLNIARAFFAVSRAGSN